MPDDLKRKAPEDPRYVNVNQEHEMNYWSHKWGVSKAAIKRAVEKVGPLVKNVKRELGIK